MRVLIADADPTTRLLVERAVAPGGHSLVHAQTNEETWAAFTAFEPPQLAVVGASVVDGEGSGFFTRLREMHSARDLYVLVLANRVGWLAGAVDAGADDALTTPVDLSALRARLRVGFRVLELQRQLASAQDSLQALALRDAVTGLYNGPAMMDALAREISRALRAQGPVSVLLYELEGFDLIVRSYGHRVGQIVLKEVGTRGQAALRPYDVVGMLTGQRFMAVLPAVPLGVSAVLGERLRSALGGTPVGLPDGRVVSVSIRVGAAGGLAVDVGTVDDLCRAAQSALSNSDSGERPGVGLAAPFPPRG